MSLVLKTALLLLLTLGLALCVAYLYGSHGSPDGRLLVSVLSLYVSIVAIVAKSPHPSSVRVVTNDLYLENNLDTTLNVFAYNSGDEPGRLRIHAVVQWESKAPMPYGSAWESVRPHHDHAIEIPAHLDPNTSRLTIVYQTMNQGRESRLVTHTIRVHRNFLHPLK